MALYRPKQTVFNTTYATESEPVNFEKYFQEFKSLLDEVEPNQTQEQLIQKVIQLDSKCLEELETATSFDLLTCEGEITPFQHDLSDSIAQFQSKLETNKNIMKQPSALVTLEKRLKMDTLGKLVPQFMVYNRYRWCPTDIQKDKSEIIEHYNNLIFKVRVYQSFLSNSNVRTDINLLQEIEILGDQKLSALKDLTECPMDYGGLTDVSGFPHEVDDQPLLPLNRQRYPSSFIFIENVFYNDTRSPELKDLSQTVMDWASGREFGALRKASMEDTDMNSIKLRLGRPYVYQHQGNCEHVILISDVRYVCPSDYTHRQFYPRVHAVSNVYGRKCFMCFINYARWLVVNNPRLTRDHSYLCQRCFKSFNYINGQKVGEFQAYEYIDPVAIL